MEEVQKCLRAQNSNRDKIEIHALVYRWRKAVEVDGDCAEK
jgi:hypothetical protein